MVELFNPSNPPVGTNINTAAFPAILKRGALWIPHLIRCRLVADVNAATRTVTFEIYSFDTQRTFVVQAPMNQTASQTVDYQIALGVNENTFAPLGTVPGLAIMPLPEMKLNGQVVLRTITNNIQAGDQFGDIAIWAEQCGS